MAIVVASAHLDDDEFVTAFCECRLPLSSFRHGDHLRLAWIFLHRYPFSQALAAVRKSIQRFATNYGVSHIYHETITTAWTTLLATHHEASFEDFIAANEYRLNRELLYRFWKPETLQSEVAKLQWVKPDNAPLPAR